MTASSAGVFDDRAFRDALGTFATGVTVISVRDVSTGAGVGITANSFTSVSLDPPLVLWCLGSDSARHRAFIDARVFGVSILRAQDEAIAQRFAHDPHFDVGAPPFTADANGAPVLGRAVARFGCTTQAAYPAGDHTIILGRVDTVEQPDGGPALTFHRGAYGAS